MDAPPPLIPPVLSDPVSSSNSLVQNSTSPARPRWCWVIHLAVIAAFLIGIGARSSRGADSPSGPALPEDIPGLLKAAGLALGEFGIFLGIAWAFSRANAKDLLLRWRFGITAWPLSFAYSVGLRITVAIILGPILLAWTMLSSSKIKDGRELMPKIENLISTDALRNPWYMFLTVTLVSFVVAGLREELWRSAFIAGVRRLAPKSWSTRRAEIVGVILGAILFGLGHLSQGWQAVLPTGILGLCLGLIMVFHQSIWPAVLAHGFFDATTFAILPWALPYVTEKLKTLAPFLG